MRLDLFPKINNMLFCELSDGNLGHLDSIVKFFFCQFNLKLFFSIFVVHIIEIRRPILNPNLFLSLKLCTSEWHSWLIWEAKLLGDIRVVQEIVKSEHSSLSLMLKYLFVRNHIRWVNFCCNIVTRSEIPQTVSSASNHRSFSLCILNETLRWVSLATSIRQLWKLLRLRLCRHFTLVNSINRHLIFSFEDFLMKNGKEIFTPFQYILINILSMLSGHALVPDIYDDENILNAHFLKLCQQFFTATFLITVIISFHQRVWILGVHTLLALVTHFAQSVCDNACFDLTNFVPSGYEAHHEVNVHLITNSSRKGLISNSLFKWLFAETDWVYHTLHFLEFILRKSL